MTRSPRRIRFRRICLAVDMSAEYGRRLRNGALEYATGKSNWELYLVRNPLLWNHAVTADEFEGLITLAGHNPFESFDGPVVTISGDPGDTDGAMVIPDNAAIGRMAAEHFLAAGFGQLGFCGAHNRSEMAHARLTGFRRAAAAHDATVHALTSPRRSETDLGGVRQWLSDLPKPVGIFTTTDSESVYASGEAQGLSGALRMGS